MSAPVFVVVGHPNKGKSSIVATLAQDDSVEIAPDRVQRRTAVAFRCVSMAGCCTPLSIRPGFSGHATCYAG